MHDDDAGPAGGPIDDELLDHWREDAEDWDGEYPLDTNNGAAIQARRLLQLADEVERLRKATPKEHLAAAIDAEVAARLAAEREAGARDALAEVERRIGPDAHSNPDAVRIIRACRSERADREPASLPLHRTEAGYPRCSTCDGGGCPDCTDPA